MPLTRKSPEDRSEQWQPAKSVRLYLDDIDVILGLLQQVDPHVHADTGDFAGEIVSADELKKLQAEGYHSLDSLELSAGSEAGQIRVRLRRPVVVRIEPRDDLRLAGAGRKIYELLNRRRTWTRDPHPDVFGVVLFSGLIAAAWIAVLLGVGPAFLSVAGVSGMTAGVSIFVVASFFGRASGPHATVVLSSRREAPTWWERNKTPVLRDLVTNAAVGAVFFFLGLWLG